MENTFKVASIVEKLSFFLKGDQLASLAIEVGFMKRLPKKLDPKSLLIGLLFRVLQGAHSLSSLAMTISLLKGIQVSKQAVNKRLNESAIRFLEAVLARTVTDKLQSVRKIASSAFRRILIQDSTLVRLPATLAQAFPGSKNWTKVDFALVKIQAVYDILTEQFCWYWFSPFTVNEQAIASTILDDFIQRGDLLIRDLGYFVLDAFSSLQNRGAFFISRLKHGIGLTDLGSGKRLDLVKTLKKSPFFDRWVIAGIKKQIKVRLIAIPVDPAVAAHRRRRARRNRDRRLNPSREHLALLGWNIFILNVGAETLPTEDVATLYGIRWRMETIFKAWKSHFRLAQFPSSVSVLQVRLSLYALFILVTLFHTFVLVPSIVPRQASISLLKLSRCFREQFWAVTLYMFRPATLYDQISYHCSYEKRHDRLNYHQQLLSLS